MAARAAPECVDGAGPAACRAKVTAAREAIVHKAPACDRARALAVRRRENGVAPWGLSTGRTQDSDAVHVDAAPCSTIAHSSGSSAASGTSHGAVAEACDVLGSTDRECNRVKARATRRKVIGADTGVLNSDRTQDSDAVGAAPCNSSARFSNSTAAPGAKGGQASVGRAVSARESVVPVRGSSRGAGGGRWHKVEREQ